MNSRMEQTLLDLKAQQEAGKRMHCPRCGLDTMREKLHHNAWSRYAATYICETCGTTEALLDMMQNPLPLAQWACFQTERDEDYFKDKSGAEVVAELWKEQIPYLIDLYNRWEADPSAEDFQAHRLEAYQHCIGLKHLWSQPFQAAYDVAEGQLLIRFRKTNTGVDVATDIIPKRKP